MARPPREEIEGGIYHVYARGNGRQRIFSDDSDRRLYLSLLRRVVERFGWRCLGYCLMNNHVHLLIETPQPNLAHGMQRLHSSYAQTFNQRHECEGHLFQGRYGAVRIETDAQLWTAVAYIATNPVRAELVAHAEDWAWSSHREILSGSSRGVVDVRRLLELLSGSARDVLAAYRALVGGQTP